MHQESNSREAVAASVAPFAAMSAMSAGEFGMHAAEADGQDTDTTNIQPATEDDPVLRPARPARVVTPAVERVLAWHRRRGG
jgi:hypothetical protein